MMVNEGLPLYLVARLEQEPRPVEHDGRPPRHGVQGRVRRHPLEPQLQAQAAPEAQGRPGALHRPVRHRDDDLVPARRGAGARPTCWSSAPRTGPTPTLAPDVPVRRHLERPRRRACARDACASRSSSPLQRGRRASSPSSTGSSSRSRCRARCSRSTTRPRTRRSRTSRSTPAREPRLVPTLNTYGPGPGPRAAASASTTPTADDRRRHHGRRQRRPPADRRLSPASSSGASSWPPRPATSRAASRSAARS